MKIGIIVEPYEERNASGIALCILNQAEGLMKLDVDNDYIIYTSKPFKKERLSGNAKNVLIPQSFLGKNFWFIKNYIFNKKLIPDILVFNMPILPLVLPQKIKTVPVFYELVYEAPNAFNIKGEIAMAIQKFFVSPALRRAVRIITPSNATKNDILNNYNVDGAKIDNIYLGFQSLKRFDDPRNNDAPSYPYFLFVGKIKFKKNIHNIIDGFIRFKKNDTLHKLYLAGDYGGDYYEELQNRVREAGVEDDVIFGGYKHNDEMYSLYKNASALVFCTLKEGFGMPVIEAMNLGVPVITSNMPPLNEVAGGAAILVDPKNTEEIAGAMGDVVSNDSLRKDLIEKGVEHAKNFSWEKHNDTFFEVINKIKNKN